MRKILLLFALFISGVGLSQTTLTLGTGTSSSSTRGPFQRSDTLSGSVFSRVKMLYLPGELTGMTSTSAISQINFDLGSSNIITATGNATMKIYMKNSSSTAATDVTGWSDIISGANLVGTYTFKTANNLTVATGYFKFVLDSNFNYSGGSLEVAVDWDCSGLTALAHVPANANKLFNGNGSLNWRYGTTGHTSLIYRAGSSSAPTAITSSRTERVNTQIIHSSADPSVIKTHSIGSSTSSSSTRGPIQRGSAASSTALYSRNNLVYTSTELLADLTSNALISSIDFDLGSTNIITASGDATLDIYMKNSTITEAPATEDWTNIISGATLVGSYTFNTTNNFPGAEGFLTFNLDTDFEYTGGTLEVSVDWNSGGLTVADAGQPELYFSGDGSLNWHYSTTAHNSVVNRSGAASAPTTLNSQKAERVNTRFTFKEMTTSTWVGTTSDWGTGSNWSSGFVPSEAVTVTIGSTSNDPVISSSTGANTRDLTLTSAGLTIQSGGSLIVGGTPSGDITYNRTLGTTNWYLVSSPVSGETMTDMRSNNAFGTGSGSNIGFAPYTTADDSWSYFTTSSTDALANGTGYSAKLNASGDISFTGTINTADVNASVSFLGNGFNLVGNPYTAYINSKTFLDANSNLDQTQLWVWNQASGMYEVKTNASAFILAPTQGFFVKANSGTQVTFGQTNQVNTGGTFQKSATTEVKLLMTDGESNRFAKIYYLDNTTKGFDTGYEGEVFGGIKNSLDVFSQLVEDNQGKNYQVQSLPVSEMESTIIPLGLTTVANKEITFAVEALNLPEGINVFLEDRKMNVFTNLNDGNYKVTLSEATNGVGRFYLHTSSKSALSVDDNLALDNISIFKTNATTLRIVGLQQGNTSVKLFNILGKQVMNSSFEANGVKDIALPNLATGVYIVKLEAEAGNLNKKIILE
ncbi:MAG: T9SS type A sorting domain-containing protein [Polaribacter sp.]|nr:T9SS type A sorting domain-containing protein [Polaribacter sp.]